LSLSGYIFLDIKFIYQAVVICLAIAILTVVLSGFGAAQRCCFHLSVVALAMAEKDYKPVF
jgi:hypothetical protein